MLWAMACHDLRLSPKRFFELTPRQLHSLVMRKKYENERLELLIGLNTSVLANHSTNQPKKAYRPYDFMPSKWSECEVNTKVQKKFTRKGFADSIRTLMKHMPSTIVQHKTAAEIAEANKT